MVEVEEEKFTAMFALFSDCSAPMCSIVVGQAGGGGNRIPFLGEEKVWE